MTIEELQNKINNTYFQKFTINKDLLLIPDDRAENDLKFMKEIIFPNIKEKRVLDIGCNFGLYSIEAKRAGANYVLGIDSFDKSIEIANDLKDLLNIDNIKFECKRFWDDILLEKKFDIILCISVYHYLFRDYRSHERIFQIFYEMCDELYWENPIDMTDYSCNEFFTNKMPEMKEEYTKEKIFEAASIYFDFEYKGTHINKTRHIYHMKRKIREEKYLRKHEILFQNPSTNVSVEKIELGNKFYALKKVKYNSFSNDIKKLFDDAYKIYFSRLREKKNIVKVYDVWNDGDYKCILMEYLDGYKTVSYADYLKLLTTEIKEKIFLKMSLILSELFKMGIYYIDIGPENFMIDIETLDVKLIDVDTFTYDKDMFNDKMLFYITRMIQWLTDRSLISKSSSLN